MIYIEPKSRLSQFSLRNFIFFYSVSFIRPHFKIYYQLLFLQLANFLHACHFPPKLKRSCKLECQSVMLRSQDQKTRKREFNLNQTTCIPNEDFFIFYVFVYSKGYVLEPKCSSLKFQAKKKIKKKRKQRGQLFRSCWPRMIQEGIFTNEKLKSILILYIKMYRIHRTSLTYFNITEQVVSLDTDL